MSFVTFDYYFLKFVYIFFGFPDKVAVESQENMYVYHRAKYLFSYYWKWMHHGFGLEFVVHLPCSFLDKFIFCFIILGRMIPFLKIQQEFTGS